VRPAGNRTGDLSLMRRVWYHKTTASAEAAAAARERERERAEKERSNGKKAAGIIGSERAVAQHKLIISGRSHRFAK
jgi:hypothetical protein